MMQQFPIFVDLHVVPPLIIGDAPALAAKVRLLRKAASLVDVIASENSQWRSEFAADAGVCWLCEIDRQAAKAAIKPADHKHWQQAHQAIRHHFQHMPDSSRSRRE